MKKQSRANEETCAIRSRVNLHISAVRGSVANILWRSFGTSRVIGSDRAIVYILFYYRNLSAIGIV